MKLINKTRILTGTAILLAAFLFLVLNIASGVLLKAVRWDLTTSKLYTLSTGSKSILKQLPEPIILRLYFSKNLAKTNPYLISFAARVEDLLIQYARASNGKIVYEAIDPEPFSDAEDQALNYGLQGLPVDNAGNDLYLGLVGTNSLDQKLVIPFLQSGREVNLEYDITQLIYKLANPQPIVVGVISSIPLDGAMQRPWMVWQQMQQQFQLDDLDPELQQIPANINTLMLVNPSVFPASTLQAIDQFVLRGGKILAFVDPLIEVSGTSQPSDSSVNEAQYTSFNSLLSAWGVSFDASKVVADRTYSKQVLMQDQGRDIAVGYPLWMDFTASALDRDDVLTTSLERITLATPGALSKIAGSGSIFSPLLTTSDQAMLMPSNQVQAAQQDIVTFLSEYEPTGKYVLAARISGPVKSAFTDGHATDANIIIVADVDMLHDHFWVNTQNIAGQDLGMATSGNGNFVLSALDNLAGSNALISIRNRGSFVRPFERLQKLQIQSQQRYHATEQSLQDKLQHAKQKLAQFDDPKQNVEEFKRDLLETRRELREVRRELNRDIDRVETWVKFFTIAFIPLLIILGGLFTWVLYPRNKTRYTSVVGAFKF